MKVGDRQPTFAARPDLKLISGGLFSDLPKVMPLLGVRNVVMLMNFTHYKFLSVVPCAVLKNVGISGSEDTV
jgi:hypothetical protein